MLRHNFAALFDFDEDEDEESFDVRIRLQFMDARLNAVSEIRDFLFLSGYGCISEAKVHQYGITHAVDCTNLPKNKKVDGVEYLYLPMDDNELQNIKQYFDSTADFIQKAAEKGGKVLVYCAAGVSRSATIVIMYLVIKEKMNLREAFTIVNKIRPIIAPNLGFWRQMIEYEQKHNHGKASVELLRGMKRPIPDVYLYKHSMLQQG
uniref:Protein-tyrosine-phosphatase n=1 Tax=Steinernema glaseri TaxID=37863 RepID=A0A1I7ZBM4_9BILA